MTDLRRWGNKDLEVALKLPSEVPYTMCLVRQSYEPQTGGGGQP